MAALLVGACHASIDAEKMASSSVDAAGETPPGVTDDGPAAMIESTVDGATSDGEPGSDPDAPTPADATSVDASTPDRIADSADAADAAPTCLPTGGGPYWVEEGQLVT